jgi:hypothetical protein
LNEAVHASFKVYGITGFEDGFGINGYFNFPFGGGAVKSVSPALNRAHSGLLTAQ